MVVETRRVDASPGTSTQSRCQQTTSESQQHHQNNNNKSFITKPIPTSMACDTKTVEEQTTAHAIQQFAHTSHFRSVVTTTTRSEPVDGGAIVGTLLRDTSCCSHAVKARFTAQTSPATALAAGTNL
jgi:hypothetical protein